MTSGFTTTPLSPLPVEGSLTIEYQLSPADFHTLDMFYYDNVHSKTVGFRLRFYLVYTLGGVIAAAASGSVIVVLEWLLSTPPPFRFMSSVQTGCWLALVILAVWLCGLIPGGFFHRYVRKHNERNFRRHRKQQLRAGLIGFNRRSRVVLSPEGFTETVTSHETSASVHITRNEITSVSWEAVSRIDLTDEHAFFTIANAAQSFSLPGFLILPVSAFPSAADFHAFVDTARQDRDAALGRLAVPRNAQLSRETRITDGR